MTRPSLRDALFHPFHLCAPATLDRLLSRYDRIHFRDYMALRLTPLMGTTAYHDRMGDSQPALVTEGRIVQGYNVSGALDQDAIAAVDRDLGDADWRRLFHEALRENRRFQRGLFDLTHSMRIGAALLPGPAALLRLLEPDCVAQSYRFHRVQQLAGPSPSLEDAFAFEYGLALVKTAAAQVYTLRLASAHRLVAVTDSPAHHALLSRFLEREGIQLATELL